MARRDSALWVLVLGVFPLFMVTPAWTQGTASSQNSNAAEEPGGPSLYEIVVTAQRRSESLKDVPISIQAVTSDEISKQTLIGTEDLASFVPTINFSTGNAADATAFSLRGVSSVATQNGIQPSTAMVLDGVPFAKQEEFVADLVDIDHIEVLNGPQGTLFGKNSTAGVINIVSKQPARDFEAVIDTEATTDREDAVRAMVNVPFNDAVRLRFNGFFRDQHPVGVNLSGLDFAGAESWGVETKLAVDLSESARFLLDAAETHINSSWGQLTLIGPSAFAAQQVPLVGSAAIGYGKAVVNTDSPAIDDVNTRRVTATFNWAPSNDLNFVSITNYSHLDDRSIIDSDGTPTGADLGRGEVLPQSTYPFKVVNVGLDNRNPITYRDYSEEARLNYIAGPVNAVGGIYYQNYKDWYQLELPINFDGAELGLIPGQRYFYAQVPDASVWDTTASAFGDVTYAVTDKFKPFAGVRYTWERISVDYKENNFLTPYSNYNPVTGVVSAAPYLAFGSASTHHVNNLSGRAGLEYLPTSGLNFYASFARGYKAPAANVSQNLQPGADPIIQPEIATAYEVGVKARLLDDRFALNLAVFHEEIRDIQEAVQPPNSQTFNDTLANAGTLTTKGVEGDIEAAVTRALKLSAAWAYVDANYGGNFSVACSSLQVSSGTCNNSPAPGLEKTNGQQAVGAPRWKYNFAGQYDDRVPGYDMSYYALVSWTWSSSIQYLLGDDPLGREPSHGLLSASVGLKGPKDRWELQFFGKNLTNKFYYSSRIDIPVIGQPIGFLPRDFQRYGGGRVIVRF